jgi:hypothetical protein
VNVYTRMPPDSAIPLGEFVEAFAATAPGSGRKKDRKLLHEVLLPVLAKAAAADNAYAVALIAERIREVVKHPDGGYENIVKLTGGVRLG